VFYHKIVTISPSQPGCRAGDRKRLAKYGYKAPWDSRKNYKQGVADVYDFFDLADVLIGQEENRADAQ
jgi:hypothetical protein